MVELFFSKHLWALAFLPSVLLALLTRWWFNYAYRKYSAIPIAGNMKGVRAARILLDRNGMANVELYEMKDRRGAHHDPRRRCVFLSPEVINGRSVASAAIAAHVVSHAIQLKREQRFFRSRMMILGLTGKVTMLAVLLVIIGLITPDVTTSKILLGVASGGYLAFVGIYLLSLIVEYRANRIAQRELLRQGIIESGEQPALAGMLNAIALMDTPYLLFAFFGPVIRLFSRQKGNENE